MNHRYGGKCGNVLLRPLEEKDIEALRVWRNDPAKTQYLRRIGEITPQMQEKWFRDYLEDPDELIFAIEETGELNRMVGSVALYHFRDGTAEAGKIQIGDEEAHGRGIGRISFALAAWIGFYGLGVSKIVASVHRENLAAYKSYREIGFWVTGSHEAPMGGIEDEIEIDEKTLREQNPCGFCAGNFPQFLT